MPTIVISVARAPALDPRSSPAGCLTGSSFGFPPPLTPTSLARPASISVLPFSALHRIVLSLVALHRVSLSLPLVLALPF